MTGHLGGHVALIHVYISGHLDGCVAVTFSYITLALIFVLSKIILVITSPSSVSMASVDMVTGRVLSIC